MSSSQYSKMLADLANAGTGKKVNPVNLVRANPSAAALISKLTQDRTKTPMKDGQGKINAAAINPANFNNISSGVARNINETDIVMQMHPDLELAAQILISSVLAPKDMTTVELTFNVANSNLPSDLVSTLIEKVRTFIGETHKIEEELTKILRSVLIEAGCFPIAVIPENSVDNLINHRAGYGRRTASSVTELAGTIPSLESRDIGEGSFKLSTGLLGPKNKETPSQYSTRYAAGLESMFSFKQTDIQDDSAINIVLGNNIQTSIAVIDNPAALYIPTLAEEARKVAISGHFRKGSTNRFAEMNLGQEDYETQFSDIKAGPSIMTTNNVFKMSQPDYVPIRPVLTRDKLKRKSIGCPLVMRLPPESVIPVYVPGYPEKHIGYFVMLDSEGNPIMRRNEQDLYYDLGQRLRGSSDLAGHVMARVQEGMKGFDYRDRGHIDYAARIYAGMVEEDLISRIQNGLYGRRFQISENMEVYRMMLARSLKNDHTALLYIPADLLTYFAIRHNEDGTGKSLMQDTRIVNSMRSVVTFANINTAVRNAISRTKVSVTMDPDDPDPLTTIETVKGEVLRGRTQGMPTGTSNPTEITNWLNTAGYEFEFQGNAGVSEMKIDFSESASQHVLPDTELEQKLRDKSIQGLGLTPEMVDAGFTAEFATTVVANNLLLSKRVIQIQDDFLPQLNKYIRSYLINSETICYRMREIIRDQLDRILTMPAYKEIKIESESDKEEFVEFILESFIEAIESSLPRPNSATLTNQLEYMEEYEKALTLWLDNLISTEFLTSDAIGEDLSGQVEPIKAAVKSYYIRRELAVIGMLPEVAELFTLDDDGKPIMDIYNDVSNLTNAMTKTLSAFMKKIRPIRDASDEVNEGKDSGGGSFGSGSDSGDMGGGDDFGGLDDMNFDGGLDDTGDDSATNPEETPTEEPSQEEPPTDNPA